MKSRKFAILFLIIPFLFCDINYSHAENSSGNLNIAIEEYVVPTIPLSVEQNMELEIPEAGDRYRSRFNWFYFYDCYLKEVCKVRLSGRGSPQFHSVTNKSLKFQSKSCDNIKLKALGSEVLGTWSIKDSFIPYEQLFGRYIAYTIAANYYKFVPKAKIVNLVNTSGRKLGHRILWDDNFENSFRDNKKINWKFFSYSDSDRILDYYWQYNGDRDRKNILRAEFGDLLKKVMNLSTMPRNNEQILSLDGESYKRFRALSTIFNSSHMWDHNLLFIEKKGRKDEIIFNLAINDIMGMNFIQQLSITHNLNYISEYFMRDPYWMHNYFKDVQFLCREILEKGQISMLYNQILENQEIFKDELLDIGSTASVPNDINGFIQSVQQYKHFEIMRKLYLQGALNICTLKWQILKDELSKRKYLVLEVLSPVGVYLDKIEYKGKDSTSDWKLINPPWWYKEEKLLLPNWIRTWSETTDFSTIRKTNNKNIIEPARCLYFYEYKSLDVEINVKDIVLNVKNAITGKPIIPIYDPKPKIKINLSSQENKTLSKMLTISVLKSKSDKYPQENILDSKNSDWVVKVFSNGKVSLIDKKKYLIDFSEILQEYYPLPLTYEAVLYYKGLRVDQVKGEIFLKYSPQVEKPQLTMENIKEYEISKKELEEFILYKQLHISAKVSDNTINLEEKFEANTKIYFIPAETDLIVTEDIILDRKDVLVLGEGTILRFNPIKKLTVGYLLAKQVQFIPSKVIWGGITLYKKAILDEVILKGVIGEAGLRLMKEGVFFVSNSLFEGNSKDINSRRDSVLVINNSRFIGSDRGIFVEKNQIRLTDITFLGNIVALKAINSVGKIVRANVEGVQNRVFWLKGADTNIAFKNIKVKNVPAFLVLQDDARVFMANISLENVKRELIDLDYWKWQDFSKGKENIKKFKKQLKTLFNAELDNKIIVIKRSTYVIDESLIIPKGYIFSIEPGTVLKFGRGVSIVAYGKIAAIGTKDEPIIFTANNQKESWGIVGLIQKEASGVFEHCLFEYGSEAYINGVYYSGMLSGYYCDIKVKRCKFQYASEKKGDDAINFRDGLSTVENCYFYNNKLDAVDFDFMKKGSKIQGCYFLGNGDDSIDVSGSETLVFNNIVEKAKDKGISLGEKSNDIIFNNLIINCGMGIAVKDLSAPQIVNNTVVDNKIGIAVYQKKKMFGGGMPSIYNTILDNKKLDFGIQQLNDKDIGTEDDKSVCIVANSRFVSKHEALNEIIKISKKQKRKGRKARDRDYQFAELWGDNIIEKKVNVAKKAIFRNKKQGDYRVISVHSGLGDAVVFNKIIKENKLEVFDKKKSAVAMGIVEPFPKKERFLDLLRIEAEDL